ncbi:hypothetical protein H8B02_10855 [Bradyrhizobium sp. Pear77]|uniref:hypothetical protein n=1 Tax=Bradyrhizobium altum TaxID=1571202 RepID=UPI001E2967CA|nr:hypothetical protein [Bradyrhizobium altum]MCC8953937.1 hypothetical protein [Bradyrhizobium altum]
MSVLRDRRKSDMALNTPLANPGFPILCRAAANMTVEVGRARSRERFGGGAIGDLGENTNR